MGWLGGIDYGTVGLLAGITLLEGLRRIPAGALVLRRPLAGGWRVAAEPGASRTALLSWWPPFTVNVVAPAAGAAAAAVPDESARSSDAKLANRWAIARRFAPVVGTLGGVVLVSLVIGIPLAISKLGITGFLGAMLLTVLSAIATGVGCGFALRALGSSRGTAWRRGLGCLNPFAAPRAIEVVYEAALAQATPIAAAHAVLAPAEFRMWIRPAVWDHLATGGAPGELLRLLSPEEMMALVADAGRGADEGGSTFCPRCGSAWRLAAGSCPTCPNAVALRPLPGR